MVAGYGFSSTAGGYGARRWLFQHSRQVRWQVMVFLTQQLGPAADGCSSVAGGCIAAG
jgi:hypothetical protein